MIKISNGTKLASRITFVLSCFPLLIVVFKLLLRQFSAIDILVEVGVFVLTVLNAYRIAYTDYTVWLAQDEECVFLKRGKQVVKFTVNEFLQFRLGEYPFQGSSKNRYYQLRINNQFYRIRILMTKSNRGEWTDAFDSSRNLKRLEDEMKVKIKMNMSGREQSMEFSAV